MLLGGSPLLTCLTLNHHGKGIHIAAEGKMDGANMSGILIYHVSFRRVINITGPQVFSFRLNKYERAVYVFVC